MTVTVCVVVKDRRELMLTCLDAILAEHPDEVVVIDNGSTDGTWESLCARAVDEPRVRVEQDRGSLGRIRNRAVELARGDIVAFTDSDCRPRPGWLAAGCAALTDGVGVVQGRTVPMHSPTVPFSATQDIGSATGLFEACNVFYLRAALEATAGFDEAVGFFGEDTAAGWAVLRAGWRDAWAQDAVVEHVVTTPGFRWHLRRTRSYANWPALLKAFPERRADLLWHRMFLRRRSAETDLAVVAIMAALLTRRPRLALGALPFARRHRPTGLSRAELIGGASSAAFDLAVSAALVRGSVRHRTAVL
jgi:glycosyltransferase involved in cell wall biosynthesis